MPKKMSFWGAATQISHTAKCCELHRFLNTIRTLPTVKTCGNVVLLYRYLIFNILNNGADLVLHLTGHQLQLPLSEVQPAAGIQYTVNIQVAGSGKPITLVSCYYRDVKLERVIYHLLFIHGSQPAPVIY
jgi:hypothetical protein